MIFTAEKGENEFAQSFIEQMILTIRFLFHRNNSSLARNDDDVIRSIGTFGEIFGSHEFTNFF